MVSVQDSVFYKAFAIVLGALVLFTISIVILANKFSPLAGSENDPLVQVQLKERLQPVGKSRIAQ